MPKKVSEVRRAPEADEVPEPPSPPYEVTPEQETKIRAGIRAKLKERYWAAGQTYRCPKCGHRTLKGSDDLQFEVPRGAHVILVYRRLRGATCSRCAARFIETADLVEIEPELLDSFRPDYEARVTTIGRESLGTYWPQDVVRNLGLAKGHRAFIEILGRDTALVHFQR